MNCSHGHFLDVLGNIYSSVNFSADFEQREKEKARIERAFKSSDKRLGESVKGTFTGGYLQSSR